MPATCTGASRSGGCTRPAVHQTRARHLDKVWPGSQEPQRGPDAPSAFACTPDPQRRSSP
jgi:hypothetical protein